MAYCYCRFTGVVGGLLIVGFMGDGFMGGSLLGLWEGWVSGLLLGLWGGWVAHC